MDPVKGRRPPKTSPVLLLACLVGLAGCGFASDRPPDSNRSVVATTSVVGDLVQRVGHGRIEVVRLLPPGADPHDYEPVPSDAQAVAEASVLVRSGGDLDAWLEDVLESAGGEVPAITLLDAVDAGGGAEPGAGGGAEPGAVSDPHWWHDPQQAVVAVEAIAAALADVDPEGAPAYRRNAREYVSELERLDAEIARCMSLVPEDDRELVTAHDGFGAFADAYGVEVIGVLIPSRSSEAQPSAGEIAELVGRIRARDVKTVFPTAESGELAEAVASEAGVVVGGELWADGLGPEGSDGETYVQAMASNTSDMVAGFTGGARSCRPDLDGGR